MSPPLDPRPIIRFKPKNRDPQAEDLKPTQEMLDLCAKNLVDSPLLRLPIDVRKLIYEYVFSTGEVIELLPWEAPLIRQRVAEPEEKEKKKESKDAMDIDTNCNLVRSPLDNEETKKRNVPTNPFACLLTSRQINLETQPFPFSCNTVYCGNFWDLSMILSYRLSSAQVSSIRTLKIRWTEAQSAVREYAQVAGPQGESSGMAKRAFKMLDGLERIIVDCQGYWRMDLEKRLMELTLQNACNKNVNISFEVTAKEVLMHPNASTCGLGLNKWKCFYRRSESVCKAGKCHEGVPLRDLVFNHVSIPRRL